MILRKVEESSAMRIFTSELSFFLFISTTHLINRPPRPAKRASAATFAGVGPVVTRRLQNERPAAQLPAP